MNTSPSIQAGPIAPVKLSLEPGAFLTELLPIVGTDKIGWPSDDHLKFAEALSPRLVTADGAEAKLDGSVTDLIRQLVRPTEDGARKCLKDAFARAGYVLDPEAEKTFVLLLSSQQFADFLAKTTNPETGRPFIVKEKKRGAKKSTFASLITLPAPEIEAPVAEATESEESAEPTDNGKPQEDETEGTETETAPVKPSTEK